MHLLGTVFCIFLFSVCNGAEIRRQKRDVSQFTNMISCTTRLSNINVFSYYYGYGCYCGRGGYGTPVDALDRCCQNHDNCYRRLREQGTCANRMYLYGISYEYTARRCSSTRPSITCKPASEYESNNWFFAFFEVDESTCAAGLCRCDAIAAKCFARTQYNQSFKNYDRYQKC